MQKTKFMVFSTSSSGSEHTADKTLNAESYKRFILGIWQTVFQDSYSTFGSKNVLLVENKGLFFNCKTGVQSTFNLFTVY